MSRVEELSAQRNWMCEYLKKAEDDGKDIKGAPIVAALFEISDTLALICDKLDNIGGEHNEPCDRVVSRRGL